MRRRTFLRAGVLAAASPLAGCSDAEIDGAFGDDVGDEEARRVLERYIEAFESGEYDDARSLLYPRGPLDQEVENTTEAEFRDQADAVTVEDLTVEVRTVNELEATAHVDVTMSRNGEDATDREWKVVLRRSENEWLVYDYAQSWSGIDYGDDVDSLEAPVRVAEQYYRALSEGDEERLQELVHPDGETVTALENGELTEQAEDASWTPEELSFEFFDVSGGGATVSVDGFAQESYRETAVLVRRFEGEWRVERIFKLGPGKVDRDPEPLDGTASNNTVPDENVSDDDESEVRDSDHQKGEPVWGDPGNLNVTGGEDF